MEPVRSCSVNILRVVDVGYVFENFITPVESANNCPLTELSTKLFAKTALAELTELIV